MVYFSDIYCNIQNMNFSLFLLLCRLKLTPILIDETSNQRTAELAIRQSLCNIILHKSKRLYL